MRRVCPVCHKKTLEYSTTDYKIPYFGRVVLASMVCSNCGFKHSDVFSTRIREPTEHRIVIEDESDLNKSRKVFKRNCGNTRVRCED